MDAHHLVLVLGLLAAAAAAAAPPAAAQLSPGFYKSSCPDVEKTVFSVIEKKFKEDPGTSAALLRLLFHDCFANGCDASILIDPLSNQSSEKEAGPNISVRGYEIIDEIKEELEKACPNVVSCADIIVLSTRDGVKLAGGPAYEVPTGRRDSLVSNREDADNNLPGPDVPIPKLMSEFSDKGFTHEEMVVLLAGGHSIGRVRCIFIEPDAAPMDQEYHAGISKLCDGANRDTGFVNMDVITPTVIDGSYFGLVLEKKMPLTVDRLLGIDSKTMAIVKAMSDKPAEFVPTFAKAMEKLSVLKVITGKEGEIRKTCSEFNNPLPTSGPSVIRISSVGADDLEALSAGAAPGVEVPGAVAEASRKVGGSAAAAGKEMEKVAAAVDPTKAAASGKEAKEEAAKEEGKEEGKQKHKLRGSLQK